MRSVLRSATVKRTVPALNDDTPDVTVSPSSTPFVMTTPDIGAVTRAAGSTASPEIGMPRSFDDLVALARGLEFSAARSRFVTIVLERLAADEALLEEALLGGELALGVLQGELGLRDAGLHVGQRLGLR